LEEDKGISRLIRSSKVRCPFSKTCEWKDEASNLEHHRLSCPYVIVRCCNESCFWNGERKEMKLHQEDCPKMPLSNKVEKISNKIEEIAQKISVLNCLVEVQPKDLIKKIESLEMITDAIKKEQVSLRRDIDLINNDFQELKIKSNNQEMNYKIVGWSTIEISRFIEISNNSLTASCVPSQIGGWLFSSSPLIGAPCVCKLKITKISGSIGLGFSSSSLQVRSGDFGSSSSTIGIKIENGKVSYCQDGKFRLLSARIQSGDTFTFNVLSLKPLIFNVKHNNSDLLGEINSKMGDEYLFLAAYLRDNVQIHFCF